MFKLVTANKNYSSWSMRAWLTMKYFKIPFEEIPIDFDPLEEFKQVTNKYGGTGKVPILILKNDNFVIWDSLAICEYLAELHPEKSLWPKDWKQRARARSICTEMHSDFRTVRENFICNLNAKFPEIGFKLLKENQQLQKEVNRINDIFYETLSESKGPFLFGSFSIADAYFAPVVIGRFRTYSLPVKDKIVSKYFEQIEQVPEVQEWIKLAQKENVFVKRLEKYRTKPKDENE